MRAHPHAAIDVYVFIVLQEGFILLYSVCFWQEKAWQIFLREQRSQRPSATVRAKYFEYATSVLLLIYL